MLPNNPNSANSLIFYNNDTAMAIGDSREEGGIKKIIFFYPEVSLHARFHM